VQLHGCISACQALAAPGLPVMWVKANCISWPAALPFVGYTAAGCSCNGCAGCFCECACKQLLSRHCTYCFDMTSYRPLYLIHNRWQYSCWHPFGSVFRVPVSAAEQAARALQFRQTTFKSLHGIQHCLPVFYCSRINKACSRATPAQPAGVHIMCH
jgi:hypothetical protein